MGRVLVVDDEPRYRDYVARFLEAEGHRVLAAAGAREAIERGAREPLDAAVLDWMLGGPLHGLHALDALRALQPRLPGVLITGFPSAELEASARRAGVTRLLEKPFEAEEIRAAVEEALATGAASGPGLPVLELGPEWEIVSASPAARTLLASAGLAAEDGLPALLDPGGSSPLERAAGRWSEVAPKGGSERWWLRVQPPQEDAAGATRLAVLHPGPAPPEYGTRARTGLLLGLESEPEQPEAPSIGGLVLVVDPELFLRRVATSLLEEAGVPVQSAESAAEVLEREGNGVDPVCAVVDEALPELERLVAALRTRFPRIAVLGQAEATPSKTFDALGVAPVLRKPWSVRQLAVAYRVLREEDRP